MSIQIYKSKSSFRACMQYHRNNLQQLITFLDGFGIGTNSSTLNGPNIYSTYPPNWFIPKKLFTRFYACPANLYS